MSRSFAAYRRGAERGGRNDSLKQRGRATARVVDRMTGHIRRWQTYKEQLMTEPQQPTASLT